MGVFKTVIYVFVVAIITKSSSDALTVLSAADKSKFATECVDAHNAVRSLHVDTPNVQWSDEIAAGAQAWAEHLVELGEMRHASSGYGENIYSAWFSGCSFRTCSNAVLAWYKEIHDYDFSTTKAKTENAVIGHFTQVVWKASLKIGVGIAYGIKSSGNAVVYIVARYDPQGNVNMGSVSSMENNVLPSKSGAVIPTANAIFSGSYAAHCGACKDASLKCPQYKKWCTKVESIGNFCRKTCNKC